MKDVYFGYTKHRGYKKLLLDSAEKLNGLSAEFIKKYLGEYNDDELIEGIADSLIYIRCIVDYWGLGNRIDLIIQHKLEGMRDDVIADEDREDEGKI